MSSNTSCITRECDAIEMSREQNAAAAGPRVAQIPLQDYFNAWLPKVSELDNRTIDKIAKSVTKKLLGLRARWKALPRYWDLGRTPKCAALRELGDVVSAIELAVSRRRGMPELVQTTQFVVNPTEAPQSVYRELTSRPDVYFAYKDPRRYSPDGTPYWLDVAVTGEFVKECDPEFPTDIYQRVLWNMHHTMREDPRRTRVFAFTIVDRDMRLWFCDRSNVVVTEPFDFIESPGHFVRFVLACLYSPYDQLGWDPTATTDWNGRAGTQPQYIFTVHSRTNPGETRQFKTLELLFNGARSIRCRATRVWKVKEWKRGRVVGKPMVLKDCWVDSSWEVEGSVVDRIRQSAETDEQKRELDEILLTTVIDGEVLRGDGQIDRTISGDLRERLIEENTSRLRVAHMSVWILNETSGDSTPAVYRWTVREPAKDHYRIVFKEVCDSLYNINDLSRIFHVLAGACKALQILHSLGWVHRDISPGNIMVCGNTVKIADFEYAKKMRRRPGKEPDPRIGTAAFRAIEVDVRMFVFTSQDSDSESEPEAPRESKAEQWEKLDQTLLDLESRSPKTLVIRRRRRKFELVEWFHNPLHDMESVFWITLYFLVAYDVFYQPNAASTASCATKTVNESDSQRARRLGYYADLTNKVFQGGRASQTRYTVVWAPGTLPAYFRAQPLHPAIAPLAGVPVVMLYALIDAYTKVEKDRKNIDRTCAQGVYEVFSAYLAKAQGHLASLGGTVLVRPVVEEVRKLREQAMLDAQAAASRKRGNAKRGREGKGQRQDNHEADMEQPRKRQRRAGDPAGDDAPASPRRSARLRKEPAEVDPLNEPNVKVLPSRRRKLPAQHHAPAAAEAGRVLRSGKRRA